MEEPVMWLSTRRFTVSRMPFKNIANRFGHTAVDLRTLVKEGLMFSNIL